MSVVTFKGAPVKTIGSLPAVGAMLPDVTLTKGDLSRIAIKEFQGNKIVLNIFPSVDTSVCALSVKKFNKEIAAIKNAKVLCVSKDLPFAQGRFCGAEGADQVVMLSDYVSGEFGKKYGVEMLEGPLLGLLARSVVVADEQGKVLYVELVPELSEEPDYDKALGALR